MLIASVVTEELNQKQGYTKNVVCKYAVCSNSANLGKELRFLRERHSYVLNKIVHTAGDAHSGIELYIKCISNMCLRKFC